MGEAEGGARPGGTAARRRPHPRHHHPHPHCPRTPWQIITTTAPFSAFADLARADPALVAQLNDPSAALTLFVPTNAAVRAYAESIGADVPGLAANATTAAVLRYHVVPGPPRPLVGYAPSTTLVTAVGAPITVASPQAAAPPGANRAW